MYHLHQEKTVASQRQGLTDFLSSSVLSVQNTSGTTKTLNVVVSDTDFLGPVNRADTAGAGTWQNTVGSDITMKWYDDPLNRQGANGVGSTPGNLIDKFSSHASNVVQGFGHTGGTSVSDSGLYSMTVQSTYTILPGGELLNRGQTEIKSISGVPELSTWAMLILGFTGLLWTGLRRNKNRLVTI